MTDTDRPSIDERMNAWLNEQADDVEIPDEDRQRFIDNLRATDYARRVRADLVIKDAGDDLASWLERKAEQLDQWVKKTFPKKEDQ